MLCIAVLHHISSRRRRLRLLAELARVLRPRGRALVTVWASEQEEPAKLQKWEPINAGVQALEPHLSPLHCCGMQNAVLPHLLTAWDSADVVQVVCYRQ